MDAIPGVKPRRALSRGDSDELVGGGTAGSMADADAEWAEFVFGGGRAAVHDGSPQHFQ
jgi:hypothetical protein